jgi:hypothetical protein
MTFTYELNNGGKFEYLGRKKMITGTFANTVSAADGLVSLGLKKIEVVNIQLYEEGTTMEGVTLGATAYPKIASLPVYQEGITIRASADTKGSFTVIGE